MKRALAVLLSVSLVSAPLSALADDTAPASPEDFGQPAQPAPAGPAPAVPALAPVEAEARPAGTVRIHFRGYKKNLDARLYQQVASDRWALVCSAPCKADLPPGTFLRATIGDGEEPHDFTVSNDLGRDLDIEVRPASRGALAGGIVMSSIGGLVLLIGTALTAIGANNRVGADLLTPGLICLGIGGGLTIGGIVLISNRSKEPRVRQLPRDLDERGRRGDAVLLPPVAGTPLGFSFTF
jgi:hypothetical protein